MQAGALALLLIGVVNLVNLLLIRANGRIKEMAVRQALGASRRHVVSEVLVEITLLTFGRIAARAGRGRRRESSFWTCWARIACRWALTSPSMREWHWSGSPELSRSRSCSPSPIAWFNLRDHLANGYKQNARRNQ